MTQTNPSVVQAILDTEQRMQGEVDRQARVIVQQGAELTALRADRAELTALRKGYGAERDRRFAPGNDEIWGPGKWVRCGSCPKDATGHAPYHHKDFHR